MINFCITWMKFSSNSIFATFIIYCIFRPVICVFFFLLENRSIYAICANKQKKVNFLFFRPRFEIRLLNRISLTRNFLKKIQRNFLKRIPRIQDGWSEGRGKGWGALVPARLRHCFIDWLATDNQTKISFWSEE